MKLISEKNVKTYIVSKEEEIKRKILTIFGNKDYDNNPYVMLFHYREA